MELQLPRLFCYNDGSDIKKQTASYGRRHNSRFGFNSMHMARIDGEFDIIDAGSESMPSDGICILYPMTERMAGMCLTLTA